MNQSTHNRHSRSFNQGNGQGHYQQANGQQGHSNQGRREYLWREQLRLRQELHRVNAQQLRVDLDLQTIHQRRATLACHRPMIIGQIILSGLVRRYVQTPGESNFHNAMQRFHQEEVELCRLGNRCVAERMMLENQIKVIESEIALL